MHLYCFLVVVISLSCGSFSAENVDPARAWLATAGMVSAWILLSHVGARVVAKQVQADNLDARLGADWLEKQLEAFRWMGLGVAVLCLGGFGAAATLDSLPYFEDSMFLQALALLSPALLMTVGTWSAEHRYGVLLGYAERGLTNHFRSTAAPLRGSLAWLVVPILILLAAGDLLALLPLETATITWITAVMILFFVPFGLPWLIRHLLKTESLASEDEQWVRKLMAAAGLRRTKAVRWNTGGRSFNAMVAGFVPPFRTLLISDRLMDELPRDQAAMVVLHEAAHLRRRHVPLRMLAILPAWAAGATVTKLAGETTWATALGTILGIALTMLILRIVAYRTEFDADVTACKIAQSVASDVEHVPASYPAAAEALSEALCRVTMDHPSSRKATWLHPGVAERVEWMRRHRAAPAINSNSAGSIANPA